MHMHYAFGPKNLQAKMPICGYMGTDDEICSETTLVTCPECRDWVIDPDSARETGDVKP